eukprot:g950.t1
MSVSRSFDVITNLKQVVDTVLKATDVTCLTRPQTEDTVKSFRHVLEDGLKGDEKTKPSIWNVLKRLAKLFPEEFDSSVRNVRTTARRDGLDSQKRVDMWIEQALLDGLMETLLEKIQSESELKNLYNPEAAILDPNNRSEILEAVEKLKRVLQSNTHSVDIVNNPFSGEMRKNSDDQSKESSSFSRLWSWSRKSSTSESENPPKSTNSTLEERAAAARLLLKELQDTSRRVIRQYSANKLPLSIKSYPLSKLCSLYEEAFSFGMRPCPLFQPSGPIKYLSELQSILTKGMASSIALLYGLETIMEVKGLNAAEFRQLPQDDDEQFRLWLHSCLLDGTFARKLEIIIENPDFMQGWYYTKALITDEDLSQQLLIACHLIEEIEILPESPRHEQQESSVWEGESSNKDNNDKEKEDNNSKNLSCLDANTLVTTSHEEGKTVKTAAHKEENAVTTLLHEENNRLTAVSHEELEEITPDDSEGQLSPLSSPQAYELQGQMSQDVHENQDFPFTSPFAEGMYYPSPDSSISAEDAVEEVITQKDSPEYQNAKLRVGDQSRTTPNGVISFTTEDEEEWSGVWKDIDVLRYEIKGNGRNDQYAVYVIEAMTSDGTQWQTARRFSELEALRKILSKKNVSLPHSWLNLSGAKGVHGKAKFGSDVLEARLVLFRQCLWDFKVTYPEALVWQPVSDFLDAPLSILKSTRLRQRLNLAYDAVLQDKFADRVMKIRQRMHLIVDLPTPIPDEVLFEIQHGSCPGCQGYLPSISHNKPMFKGSPSPRKCEYTELLYCHACHHLDSALLPSKILNEWDFRKSLVSVGAKKYILSIFPHPVLCINSVNPGLLASVPVLGHLQYIRLDIIQKLDALRRKGQEGKRIAEVFEKKAGDNVYLLQNADYWSLKDLGDISRGFLAVLPRWLEMIHSRITKLVTLKDEELALGAIFVTPNQLEALLNEILQNDQKLPYAFFLSEKLLETDLQQHLEKNNVSVEASVKIVYQPQAVFRVRPITRCSSSLEGHTEAVLNVSFSPDGKRLATGSGDTTIRLWDLNSQTPSHTLKGHRNWVLVVSWSPDGLYIATGDMDGQILLWNPDRPNPLGGCRGHKKWITSIAWRPAHLSLPSIQFCSGSKDCTIRIWNATTKRCELALSNQQKMITCVRWGGNDLIYSSSRDTTISVWNSKTGSLITKLQGHSHWVNTLALSSDHTLRTGAFDRNGYAPRFSSEAQKAAMDRYKESTNGKPERLVSGSDDHTMILWNPSEKSPLVARLTGHMQLINQVQFSPDGRWIISASFDKSIKVWDGVKGTFYASLFGHVGPVFQVSWSPDSRFFVSGSKDSTLKVWDVKKKKLAEDLPGHADEVYSVDWSPNGGFVASGGKDRVVKIWRH